MGPSGGPITKDNTGVEYYGTIFAVAESPLDGRVCSGPAPTTAWSTSRATAARPGRTSRRRRMPEWALISQIDASPHDAGHRLRSR